MAGANLVQEDEILGKAYDARLMRRIVNYLRPYKLQVAIAFVLIFATAGADLAPPFLTRWQLTTPSGPRSLICWCQSPLYSSPCCCCRSFSATLRTTSCS